VQVQLNGEPKVFAAPLTVGDLLLQLGLNERRIAVEINREIIDRTTYATRGLAEGDEVEIVHFVGGG